MYIEGDYHDRSLEWRTKDIGTRYMGSRWGKLIQDDVNRRVITLTADVPLSRVGGIVPYIIGMRRISEPNVLYYGNLRAQYQTTRTITTVSGWRPYSEPYHMPLEEAYIHDTIETVTVPVGFLTDITLGLCLGPDVILRGIYVDNVRIWAGSAGPHRTVFTIGENDTAFSNCEVAFHGGANNQPVDPWSQVNLSYPGIAYLIMRGMRADISTRNLMFEVERFPNPLGLSSGRNRLDDDINPATAIYDIVTNPWGGAGLPATDIDVPSLLSAAAIFAAEANYCSVVLSSVTSVQSILGILQEQTHSILYHNSQSGKMEIKPIREGAVSGSSTLNFNSQNIVDVRNFNKSSWATTYEMFTGTYAERASNYDPTPVNVQNISNVAQTGRTKNIAGATYPFVTKADLALFLASRDLAVLSSPTYSFSLLTNRDGAECTPGQIVTVNYSDYGLYGVPMVVDKVRKHTKNENTVLLDLSQYLLPNRGPLFSAPADAYDPMIGYGPVSPSDALIISIPYWILEYTGVVDYNISVNIVYPAILAIPANDLQSSFKTYISNVPIAGKSLTRDATIYSSYGMLDSPIDKYDGFDGSMLSHIDLIGVINPVHFKDSNLDEQRLGSSLIFIGNEIFTYTSAVQLSTAVWRLNGVRRALLDTAPVTHPAGSNVYIIGTLARLSAGITFTLPHTYTPQWRLVSSTFMEDGKYNDAYITTNWENMSAPRTLRPVRPHDTRIDGVRSSVPALMFVGKPYVISWKTRRRSSDNIKFQTDDAEVSEFTGIENERVFHRVYIRDGNNTQRLVGTTPNDDDYNSLEITLPPSTVAGNGTLYVRAVNQYGESLYDDTLPILIVAGPAILAEDTDDYLIAENTDNNIAQE